MVVYPQILDKIDFAKQRAPVQTVPAPFAYILLNPCVAEIGSVLIVEHKLCIIKF